MKRIRSEFDDFFLINVLADLFDPEGSDDIDFVTEKIIEGLDKNGFISDKQIVKSPKVKTRFKEERNKMRDEDSFAA
mgnify:CR=1 FL=1